MHFSPLFLISSACTCSCHAYTSFSWGIDECMTKRRHYALLNKLSGSYQGACSPPNFTPLLPDWGWFSWAKYKTEGRQGRRGVSVWRCSAAAGTPAPGPAPRRTQGDFSLCCCCWENHSWVPKCSPHLTSASHIISGSENISKKKKKKQQSKSKPNQPPRRYYLAQWEKPKCKELLTGAGDWCTK